MKNELLVDISLTGHTVGKIEQPVPVGHWNIGGKSFGTFFPVYDKVYTKEQIEAIENTFGWEWIPNKNKGA